VGGGGSTSMLGYEMEYGSPMPASIFGSIPGGALMLTLSMAIGAGLGSCVLAPPGTTEQEARLGLASPAFEPRINTRQLPALPVPVDWRDLLSRAFLVNGELESAYFEWKAALARIDQAAVWPNSNVAVSFSYMFSSDNIKSWNRTTIAAGFDPAMNLSLPTKARAAGKVALEAARESREISRHQIRATAEGAFRISGPGAGRGEGSHPAR
jgi:outer membrane protein, heavy metal efflux system